MWPITKLTLDAPDRWMGEFAFEWMSDFWRSEGEDDAAGEFE
jgi:hypothetical protein